MLKNDCVACISYICRLHNHSYIETDFDKSNENHRLIALENFCPDRKGLNAPSNTLLVILNSLEQQFNQHVDQYFITRGTKANLFRELSEKVPSQLGDCTCKIRDKALLKYTLASCNEAVQRGDRRECSKA